MEPIEICKMETRFIEPSFDLAAQVFCKSSTLHKLADISVPEYKDCLKQGFLDNVSQGLSAVAVTRHSKDLLGCVIACDFLDQGETKPNPKLAAMQNLFLRLEQDYIKKKAPKPGQSVLVDMALVDPDHLGLGVYQKLRDHIHEIARDKGFEFVVGELSSAATQNVVVNKMGHKILSRIAFDQFEFEGRKPFQSIREPKEIWLTEGAL